MKVKDIQNENDIRNLTVDQVGVYNITYPITVKDKTHNEQKTVANIDMMVQLMPEFKGTHMSRFIEILNNIRGEITMANIPSILRETRNVLASPRSSLSVKFPYFIEKISPVSEARSLFSVDVMFSGFSEAGMGENFILGVRVPVTTLCPCSKEISEYGAHNQRSRVSIYLNFKDFIWVEDIVAHIESCASSEIFPLLKRSDEKYVTEKAYKRPRFAEDMVRSVAERFMSHEKVKWFLVETMHEESIHTHNAYARIERFKEQSELLSEHLRVFKGFELLHP
ncbi:MAG: GTP cyclohydrolase FolE2 [bacterium]